MTKVMENNSGATAPLLSREERNGITPEIIKDYFRYENGKLIRICFPGKDSGSVEGKWNWGKTGSGYMQLYLMGKAYQVHRLIWVMHNGFIPHGMCLDHINGDKEDNRIENIRCTTHRGNSMNLCKHREGTHIPGVYWKKSSKKWIAYINVNGQREWLGSFKTKEEADLVRKEAEARFFTYMI